MSNPTTTGEWTADYVADRFTIDASSAGHIADAHNAALAAEREKWKDVAAAFKLEDGQLKPIELAAERENNDAQAEAYVRRINDLNTQLAAERGAVELWKTENESRAELIRKIAEVVGYDNSDGFHSSPGIVEMVTSLREQLAAEQEKKL